MGTKAATLCLSILLVCGASCGYLSIGKKDDVYEKRPGVFASFNSAVIIGTVRSSRNSAVMVMALDGDGGLVEYVILDRPGRFMLYVPEGRFRVFATADMDENGVFTDDETFAMGGGSGGLSVRAGEVASDLEVSEGTPFSRPQQKIAVRDDGSVPRQKSNGDIAKIYNEAFCLKNAAAGWWKPTLFMKAYGANIYLTAPYDPRKIPVLFVHGAEGSPQNWAYFHFRMDSSRYQPWYYYYPSGIRLSLASRILHESLIDLKKKHGFTKICIVAHSMGGLIARYFLCNNDLQQQGIEVRLFATLASPWSGFESADRAMSLPSKKLPSWIDMASQSEFIRRALNGHLPPPVSHHLFYGKGDSVAQGRALDERVFMEAKGKHGFDVNHDTILSDRAVFLKFSEILSREL